MLKCCFSQGNQTNLKRENKNKENQKNPHTKRLLVDARFLLHHVLNIFYLKSSFISSQLAQVIFTFFLIRIYLFKKKKEKKKGGGSRYIVASTSTLVVAFVSHTNYVMGRRALFL